MTRPTRVPKQGAVVALKLLSLVVFVMTGCITSTRKLIESSNNGPHLDLPRDLLCAEKSQETSALRQVEVKPDSGQRPIPLKSTLARLIQTSSCQAEYERVTSNRTKGFTEDDLEQSRALIGNRHRLALLSKKLQDRQEPVNAVVCGGSITIGHGVQPGTLRYSNRLEAWMNDYFPIASSTDSPKHTVFNRGSHGADICAMAKRVNIMIKDLPPEPDLFVLEFAVNDYQGQDHKIHLDHKTDVFFEGFEKLALCAEIVVHKLLSEFPKAAVMFLEMQTAIENRKTGATLHMGVAKHYQVPVASYAETFFPDFYRLMDSLKEYNYSTATIGSTDSSFTADPVLPFPHGCVPCRDEFIIPSFRDKGCKSLCTFAKRSGRLDPKSKCDKDIPGREQCYVSFLAHDAVHPSAMGHQMAADLIAETIARTGREVCQGREYLPQILPQVGLMVDQTKSLSKYSNFVLVKDTMGIFAKMDPLRATRQSKGFQKGGDSRDRPGWIATNPAGNEFVEYSINLPESCYVVYLAVLKSYENMGTFNVTVKDEKTGRETVTNVDGSWEPKISIPSDFPVTSDGFPGCTGNCTVRITTDPQIKGRKGNKVKIVTLSARECMET